MAYKIPNIWLTTNYPIKALLAIQETLELGEAQGHKSGAWRDVHPQIHIGKMLHHLGLHLAGDRSEPHLKMAFTRLAFVVDLDKDGEDITEEECHNE